MTLEEILDRFHHVRRSNGGYMVSCPAHEDSQASLSLKEVDGRVLVHCFAGCATEDVLEALGLSFSDIGGGKKLEEPEAVYRYEDERGRLLYEAVRFPGKRFKYRRISDDGEWVWNLDGARLVPYRLPEVVVASSTIYITEGEKDVDRLRSLGKLATTSPMGAGKWKDEYSNWFAGVNVIIVADRDQPGRAHAKMVHGSLCGVANSVHVVQAKEGKDVSDHLDAGLPLEELVVLDPLALSRNYHPVDLFQPTPPVKWVVENVVVGGEATLLVADGGSGKSYFALAMSLCVAAGVPFLGQPVKQGRVIYVDEEGSNDLALQRFQELGATTAQRQSIDYLNFSGVDMVKNPDLLIEDVKLTNAVLVVIDSHAKVTSSSDENSNNEMGRIWDKGFLKLARDTGAAVLVVHHTSAYEGKSKPRGASQIRNSADQVLTMFEDRDPETKKGTGLMIVYPSKPRRMTQRLRFTFDKDQFGSVRLREV